MKEAVVQKDLSVQIRDLPVPKPGPGEVLIKIAYAGCNPKDWKYPIYHGGVLNTGDDMAGTIVEVGEGVVEFHPGDRVAAMHVMGSQHGSFAEYGIAPASTTFMLPSKTSFEEVCYVNS
jgi:NADPH2:quinone reductase